MKALGRPPSHWLQALAITALCALQASAGTFAVKIDAALSKTNQPANSSLSGNNIQWVDNGDGILNSNKADFAQPQLDRLTALGISVLRYPGGTLSDLYHWQAGIGPLANRATAATLAGAGITQTVRMGTQEFLELCEATHAQPLITVNVMTGSAQEAANWVAYTNKQDLISSRTGRILPKVYYWEIGNEPYLKDDALAGHWISAADYAKAASAFIAAMKAVDSSIQVGIPLRSDKVGGIVATPYPGWNETVLSSLQAHTDSFDYVALHNAYFPYANQPYSDSALFAASMAGTQVLADDLAATQAQLKQHFATRNIPLAITEFNSFYGTSGTQANYVATFGGALYVADALGLMAQRSDILLANFWSAAGNWVFGALDNSGQTRPAYDILQNFSQMQRGKVLPLSIQAPLLPPNTPVGVVPTLSSVASVAGYATLDKNTARFMLINKDPLNTASLTLSLGQAPLSVEYRQLASANVFDLTANALQKSNGFLQATETIQYNLAPHSIAFLDITLADNRVFSTSTADCLFNWAAQQLPELFAPATASSATSPPYYYRHFVQSRSYLGTIPGTANLYYLKEGEDLLDISGLARQSMDASGCQ